MKPSGDLLALRDWSLDRQTDAGPVSVLRNIDLDLRTGEWLAVIGANGSGKSSLLKFLASEDSPLADQAAMMFQDPDEQIFASTARREIALGRGDVDPDVVLSEFGLADMSEVDPRVLSAGQKQRLVLAVAMGGAPQVLFCDEPTSLQDPQQAAWVLDKLDAWRRATRGALITTSCDRNEVMRADQLLVLADGQVLVQGTVASLINDPRVVELLGSGAPSPHTMPAQAALDAIPILKLSNVGCVFSSSAGLQNVELEVRPGERWGLVGANGCGKSTLLAVCAGVRQPDEGQVTLGERELYKHQNTDLDHGFALLAPQFPEYLFTRSTVAEEIALDPKLARRSSEDLLLAMGLSKSCLERNPHELSSGQRRRLALGLILHAERPVVLLDEPTAALDAEGRRRVLDMLAKLPVETAVVIASHDIDFLAQAGCLVCELGPRGLSALRR
ncbi:MAG: energy-coupling factor transporter ATP-binding protein EcfA2 [Candidatus Krumholzibacteriia bacterium]|jgi:energy-coupling factor transporter ATP-binding protein EcfA2